MCDDDFKFGVLEDTEDEAPDDAGEISKEDFLTIPIGGMVKKSNIVAIEKGLTGRWGNSPAVVVRYEIGSKDALYVIECYDEQARVELLDDIHRQMFNQPHVE